MRACANGERSTAAWRAFATGSRSSMKRPSPRSSASSSRRGSGRPTHGSEAALAPTRLRLLSPCGRASRRSPRAARGCSRRDDEPGRRARDRSPSCRIAISASPGSTSIASCARAPRGGPRRGQDARAGRGDLRRAPRGRGWKRARDARRRRGARGRPRGGPGGRGGRARTLHLGRPRRARAARPRRRGLRRDVRRPDRARGADPRRAARDDVVVHEDVGVAGVHRLGSGAARSRAGGLRRRGRGDGRCAREPRRRARAAAR